MSECGKWIQPPAGPSGWSTIERYLVIVPDATPPTPVIVAPNPASSTKTASAPKPDATLKKKLAASSSVDSESLQPVSKKSKPFNVRQRDSDSAESTDGEEDSADEAEDTHDLLVRNIPVSLTSEAMRAIFVE